MGDENSMGLPQEEYEKLMAEYRQSIPQQIKDIETAMQNLKTEFNKDNLVTLRLFVHRMSGSACVYGYNKVTEICREVEGTLVHMIEGFSEDTKNTNQDTFFPALGQSLNSIRKEFV